MAATLRIVNPAVQQWGDSVTALSPRMDTLSGKTVGLLWNAKPNGDVALRTVQEVLESAYEDIEFRFYSGSQPHPQSLLDAAASECDAVIACTAD